MLLAVALTAGVAAAGCGGDDDDGDGEPLTPPEGDEQQVTEILDAAQSGIDEIEQDPSLLNQGPDAGGAFTEANQLAEGYGLTDCGG